MTGNVSINLPLKPHLKKYLVKKYGDSHVVSRHSWLGRYIIDLLDKNYRKNKANIEKGEFYTFVVPASIIQQIGFDVSPAKYNDLAIMINKVFLNDLYSYIDVSIAAELKFHNPDHDSINKQNRMRAISQFLLHYGITEDEVAVSSIYRAFDRETKREAEHSKNPAKSVI